MRGVSATAFVASSPVLSAFPEKSDQCLFRYAQQGPPEVALAFAHARRSRRACAAQQVHEHRLRLIAGVVGSGDARRPRLFFCAAEKGVAQTARGRFQPLARQAGGGHIGALTEKGHAQARAEFLTKGHIRDGISAADAMLKVRRAHVRARVQQQEQQRHRVRPAGKRHERATARRSGVDAQRAAIHVAISSMSVSLTRASAAM